MVCSKCQCDFCYNCERRRLGIKFFGSHESRLSPSGYKYNVYPHKPILRHTVRGLVIGAATLAIPVAAVGAVGLLAAGTTIGAPTYGTYRLVKHIRSKCLRHHRRQQMEALAGQWATQDSLTTYINGADERNREADDIQRALQASLITFREENARREVTPYPIRRFYHLNQNNEDDDEDEDEDIDYH